MAAHWVELLFEDPVRADAPRMVRALRAAGIDRVVLVTGDRAGIAQTVGRIVGVDAVHAEQDPADKLEIVREASDGAATIMVGDGINDAPRLPPLALALPWSPVVPPPRPKPPMSSSRRPTLSSRRSARC